MQEYYRWLRPLKREAAVLVSPEMWKKSQHLKTTLKLLVLGKKEAEAGKPPPK